MNIQAIQRGGECKHVHFPNRSVVPAIEPLPASSHFLLKWFQFSTNVMLSVDRNGPAPFFQWSSIIHDNQNPSANPGNYWFTDSQSCGRIKETHAYAHCHLTMCDVRNQKHIYTLQGLNHAFWLPPLFTEVILNTLWNYKKFKSALQTVAGT